MNNSSLHSDIQIANMNEGGVLEEHRLSTAALIGQQPDTEGEQASSMASSAMISEAETDSEKPRPQKQLTLQGQASIDSITGGAKVNRKFGAMLAKIFFYFIAHHNHSS